MSLASGARLGPYEILAPLGAGGMGEVYKARDTRLDRIVAVKVLPDGSAALPDMRRRFEREARAVSALNHAHICSLFDIGQQNGIDYLVMEFLEGETLAEQIRSGPLPVEKALRYAIDIAGALEAAHSQGIIHRDLKPGNIMITPAGPKILDFGLAKIGQQRLACDGSEFQTLTTPLTGRGTIVGTLQYMAPEQLEGKDADARTDLFAFGSVMYEMITGRRAFQATSQAALITSIMTAEPPPVSTMLAAPALDHLVRTSLSKDPAERWQSARDVLVQLKWIASVGSKAGLAAPVVARRRSIERLLWISVAGLLLTVAALGILYVRRAPADPVLMRLQIDVPPNFVHSGFFPPALSPDGRYITMLGSRGPGRPTLWLRSIDSLDFRLLPGTEGAIAPFWSQDSRFIGFFADMKLKKLDVVGMAAQTICETGAVATSGTWNRDGTILFSSIGNPLRVVSAMGGEPRPVLSFDAKKEQAQLWPWFLPDGRHFLYCSKRLADNDEIRAGSLDSTETRTLLRILSAASYSPRGLLMFVREQTLMAQAFDVRKLQLSGDAFPVASGIERSPNRGSAAFSISQTGLLAWRGVARVGMQVVAFTKDGRRIGAIGDVVYGRQIFLSPDEKRLSMEIKDQQSGAQDIWLLELSTAILSRVTADAVLQEDPIWSPDSRELMFSSSRKGFPSLYRKMIGGPPEKPFFSFQQAIYPTQWLPDGSVIFLGDGGRAFYRLPPGGDLKPVKLFESKFPKDGLAVSPDGRWVAYNSRESDRWQVYVASYPGFMDQRQISKSGGCQPLWRKDGRELFYITQEGKLMSVNLRPGPPLEAGSPQPLFQTTMTVDPGINQYAVTGDGNKIFVLETVDQATPSVTLVVNWTAGLGR